MLEPELGFNLLKNSVQEEEEECSLDVSGLDVRRQPLFLHKNGSDLLLPDAENENRVILKVAVYDKLTATCPGASLKGRSPSLSYECLQDKTFRQDNHEVPSETILSDLSCSKSIQETLSDLTDSPCGPEGAGGNFVEVMNQLCNRFLKGTD